MRTNDQNPEADNRQKGNNKQQRQDQPQAGKNNAGKKPVYIKDMTPIDVPRPGII